MPPSHSMEWQTCSSQSVAQLDDKAITSYIVSALDVTHSHTSSNDQRVQALNFLNQVQELPRAAFHGYTLAIDKAANPLIRHYGLSLLLFAVTQTLDQYPESQSNTLRQCVVDLVRQTTASEPPFLRNKIAKLWVELVKRIWIESWSDMDKMLVDIWESPEPVHKELVLTILALLADEVFAEDGVPPRDAALKRACIQIFSPAKMHGAQSDHASSRSAVVELRHGEDGWISRITIFLRQCLETDLSTNEAAGTCAIKVLHVYQATFSWTSVTTVSLCGCLPVLITALQSPHITIQKPALDALTLIYTAHNVMSPEEAAAVLFPLYHRDFVELCGRVFEWAKVDANDIDDDKYHVSKRLTELIGVLAINMLRRWKSIPETVDKDLFLQLLLITAGSESFVVSVPIISAWCNLLHDAAVVQYVKTRPFMESLLLLCGSRCIKYENLPEDCNEPIFLLLSEDTDTVVERQAFLNNYRRMCIRIIEIIATVQLSAALNLIVNQTEYVLEHLYDNQPPFSPVNYSKYSLSVLKVDGQCTVLEAVLRAYAACFDRVPQQDQQNLQASLEAWYYRLLHAKLDDPAIRRRILQLLLYFSTVVFHDKPAVTLKLVERILVTWPASQPQYTTFNEAIKDLQNECISELQRLGSRMADHLLGVYDELEAKIRQLSESGDTDPRRRFQCQNFLFLILQRTTKLSFEAKLERIRPFVAPTLSVWQDPGFHQSVSSLESLVQLLGLDKAQQYMVSHRMHLLEDWASQPLDAEGLALAARLEECQTQLPLRPTKSFLEAASFKTDKHRDRYEAAVALWKDSLPVLLRTLLDLIRYTHACHDWTNWTGLPAEQREKVVMRIFTDRFWQSGISEGSKDDFYARLMNNRNTCEGLASGIRGVVRFVRESCYSILEALTKFDVHFYGFEGLANPLASALYSTCSGLTNHQLMNLLQVTSKLVRNCPAAQREQFLPPILSTAIRQIDGKVDAAWSHQLSRENTTRSEDDLTEEMKEQSILRHLTNSAVTIVADILDPSPRGTDLSSNHQTVKQPSLRSFCIMNAAICEQLLVFLSHAIRWKDSRGCTFSGRVLLSLVSEFSRDSAKINLSNAGGTKPADPVVPQDLAQPIREFMSTEVVKACITSFADPYFIDHQRDLAMLVAVIISHYHGYTASAKRVLLSLPNISPQRVELAVSKLTTKELSPRQQRVIISDLLDEIKGVSLSEIGKLAPPSIPLSGPNNRSRLVQNMMSTVTPSNPGDGIDDSNGAPLESVSGLFDMVD